MSQGTCCSFCEQLPCIADPRRGSAGRCPLCRQELWTIPNGVTHRLVATDDPAAPRKSRGLLFAGIGVGVLASACVAIVVGWAMSRSAPQAPAPTPVVVQPLRTVVQTPVVVEHVELPPVAVKRAIPANAARVKPAKSMEPIAKAGAKPVPYLFADEGPRSKGLTLPIPVAWNWSYEVIDEDTLLADLKDVPQLDLEPEYASKTKKDIAAMARDIANREARSKDVFVNKLLESRPDLSGLPFLLGKDCTLDKKRSAALALGSLQVRSSLAAILRRRPTTPSRSSQDPTSMDRMSTEFWAWYKSHGDDAPALHQILSAHTAEFRVSLAEHMGKVKGADASMSLAKLALYDLNAEVRREALKSLANRPKEEYLDEVVRAFRYPWAPAARHASQASSTLKLKELIPDLVKMLDQPDPFAPYPVKARDGKQKTMIRELVRINHHRNCLLCHTPMEDGGERGIPIGPVPSMQEPLPPPTAAAYYSERRGVTLVRADVTYLRQDFSVLQEVKDSRNWPKNQRFDFFVREREFDGKRASAAEDSPHQQAVLRTLRDLTGKNHPARASAWVDDVLAAPLWKKAK